MADWGGAAKGAAGGAAMGAALGPWGAAAGGVIGGVAGLFGGDSKEAQKYDYGSPDAWTQRTFGGPDQAYDQQAAHAQGADPSNYNQDRGVQQSLYTTLTNAANGMGPSAAGIAAGAQRQAGAQQAQSIIAGGRGRTTGANARFALNSINQNNSSAAQNEAFGRANEMNTARGQQLGLAGQMASQDQGMFGMNQQNNQFNAGQTNQIRQGNQQTSYDIGQAELAARLHQGDMQYGNLDPGSPGVGNQIMTAGAVGLGSYLGSRGAPAATHAAHGTVAIPHYADGGVTTPNYQLMGIGQRRVPMSDYDLSWGKGLADALTLGMGTYESTKGRTERDQQAKAQADKIAADADYADRASHGGYSSTELYTSPGAMQNYQAWYKNLTMPMQAGPAGGVTSPSQAYAHGGVMAPPVSRGPHLALVGEAGPEAVVNLDQIVDRPTHMVLGGRPQAVIPLSPQKGPDRDRTTALALALKNAMGGGR